MNPHAEQLVKKPYQTPALRVYGDLKVITQAVGMALVSDDGGKGDNKTQ